MGYVLAVITALLLLASAMSGYFNPGRNVLLTLFSLILPYMWVATIFVLVLLLVFRQWRPALVVGAAIVLSWGSIRLVSPITLFRSHASETDRKLTLVTFNVRNFGIYDGMQKDINPNLKYVLDTYPDVAILQEASLTRNHYESLPSIKPLLKELNKKYPYRSHGWHDVIIMSKYPYRFVEQELKWKGIEHGWDQESDHRVYFAKVFDVFAGDDTVRVIGVHLNPIGLSMKERTSYEEKTRMKNMKSMEQNKNNLRWFYRHIAKKLKQASVKRVEEAKELRDVIDRSPRNVILCGDFNDPPASYVYRTIRGSDMRDAYVDCCTGPAITYHENRMYFKIDHVLYRGGLRAVSSEVVKQGDSDHYPQLITFKFKN